jgi:hypothetical protein
MLAQRQDAENTTLRPARMKIKGFGACQMAD